MLKRKKILSFISAIICLQLNAQDKQIFINYYLDSKVETTQTFPLNSGIHYCPVKVD